MKKALKHSFLRRVLLILFIFALPLSGCVGTPKAKFEKGFDTPIGHYDIIQIGATSDKNTFPVDNVSFEIYYGFNETEKEAEKRLNSYTSSEYENGQVIFATYILKGSEYDLNFNSFDEHQDYKTIDNCIFIRDISQEEAVTDEYTYKFSDPRWLFFPTKYKHSETLTVPEEVFSQQKGEFCFVIISLLFAPEDNTYRIMEVGIAQFAYQKQDNTVEITF